MASVRFKIVEQAMWGFHNALLIHYPPGDVRREPVPFEQFKAHRLPITIDCSEFAACCYYAAGAPDPTGTDWGRTGPVFTGTMLSHLPHIPGHSAQAGDLIVIGGGTGEHVVVIVQAGPDPLVVSHGFEGGPLLIRLSLELTFHRDRMVTYLRGVSRLRRRAKPRWTVHGDGDKFIGLARHHRFWMLRHPRRTREQKLFIGFHRL